MLDLLPGPHRNRGTVLFVFPHPDDDVFVGGVLSLLVRAGARVDAAWMTSGGYDGLERVREDEMRQAMDIAGVERRHLLRLPDGRMIGALPEACAMLQRLIGELRPQAVIGPAFEGGHADHDATSFAVAEASRRAAWDAPIFEYPCYAPDPDAANGLRLAAFPADMPGVQRIGLDEAAMRCKASMAEAYASQKEVFGLLRWRPSSEESFRRCPRDRDHRHAPIAGLDSYAHWFNWRSADRFEQLAAAIASSATAASARSAPVATPVLGQATTGGNEMQDFRRLQRLCMLETGQRAESPADSAYLAWMKAKRPFARDEVVGSYMLKLGELCGGYLIHFHADGTVTERYMFRPEKSWTCRWTLDDAGVIHLVCPAENDRKEPVRCSLDIVASAKGNVHAGCEDTDEADNNVIEHFKLFYLGPTVALPGAPETLASTL